MKKDYKQKLFYALYGLIIVLLFGLLFWLGHFTIFKNLIDKIEQNSFDIRQTIISSGKENNKDIVILAIDDETYERYGINKATFDNNEDKSSYKNKKSM